MSSILSGGHEPTESTSSASRGQAHSHVGARGSGVYGDRDNSNRKQLPPKTPDASRFFWALVLLLALNSVVHAEDKQDGPPALTEYQGRRIAQTMHWLGAEWLIRNER